MEDQWKFQMGGGSQKPKRKVWGVTGIFRGVGEFKPKHLPVEGVWIFHGTTHFYLTNFSLSSFSCGWSFSLFDSLGSQQHSYDPSWDFWKWYTFCCAPLIFHSVEFPCGLKGEKRKKKTLIIIINVNNYNMPKN